MLIAWARSVGCPSAYVWKRLARGLEMVLSESVNSLKTKAAIATRFRREPFLIVQAFRAPLFLSSPVARIRKRTTLACPLPSRSIRLQRKMQLRAMHTSRAPARSTSSSSRGGGAAAAARISGVARPTTTVTSSRRRLLVPLPPRASAQQVRQKCDCLDDAEQIAIHP